MTEARRLLERIVEAHEVEDWLDIRQEIATYLAQPMTTCEGLTEEEQEWYVDAGYDEAGERIAPTSKTADRMQTVLRSLAESRVREGELVAALDAALAHCEELREAWERGALDEHDGKGGLRSNRNLSVVLAIRAALAQGKGVLE